MSCLNIKVAIKARPILKRERDSKLSSQWKIVDNSIRQSESHSDPFYFDHIFDQDIRNHTIFDTVAKPIVDAALKGFNGTIFAYGQTSSGKTYTMLGDDKDPGVMILTANEIFKEIELAVDRQFLLRVGYIEIYNEKIFDLLHKTNQDLKIHETSNGEVSVNCEEFIITSKDKMIEYLQAGSKQRKIGETNMNERSSRSHAIFRIIIESKDVNMSADEGSVQISNLNLVDLAGSERADLTGATGYRLKEGAHINKSLLSLSCVINKLSENESSYVNYRDSKLTRILQASLGGNALTAIICNINPTAIEETNSTLSFAMRAKSIKNKPQVNEVLSDAALMKRLEKKIARLESELQVEKTKNSKIKIIQLERQIHEEEIKIVHSHARDNKRDILRRRTWSASVNTEPIVKELSELEDITRPNPKLTMPLITIRNAPLPSIEEFKSPNDISFERLSIGDYKDILKTPEVFKNKYKAWHSTPPVDDKLRCKQVEQELEELKAFTNLENKFNVDHEIIPSLQYKLQEAQIKIKEYEKEKLELLNMKIEWNETEEALKLRCSNLENEIKESKVREKDYATKLQQSALKIKKLEMELNEKNSLEFQQEQHKKRAKVREGELLEALNEKEQVIKSLNEKLVFERNVKSEASGQKSTIERKKDITDDVQNEDFVKHEKLIEKCEHYEKTLENLGKKIDKMQDEMKLLQSENDELSNQLIDALQDNDRLKHHNNGLQTEIDHLHELVHGAIKDNRKENINYTKNDSLISKQGIDDDILKMREKLIVKDGIEIPVSNSSSKSTSNTSVNNLEQEQGGHLCNLDPRENLPAEVASSKLNDVNMREKGLHLELQLEELINENNMLRGQLQLFEERESDLKSITKENHDDSVIKTTHSEQDEWLKLGEANDPTNFEQVLLTCKEEIKTLNAEIYALKAQKAEIEDKNCTHIAEISSLKSDLCAKANEMTQLNDQLAKLSQTKEECQARLNNLEPLKVKNDILTTEITEIKVQISKQLETIENLNEQISFLQCEINKKRALNIEKQNSIDISVENSNEALKFESDKIYHQNDVGIQVCEGDHQASIDADILNSILQDTAHLEIIIKDCSFILHNRNYTSGQLHSEVCENHPVKIKIIKCVEKSMSDSYINWYEGDMENMTSQLTKELAIESGEKQSEDERKFFTMFFILLNDPEKKSTEKTEELNSLETSLGITKSLGEINIHHQISDVEKSALSNENSREFLKTVTEGLDIQLSNKLSDILSRIHELDKKIGNFENYGEVLRERLGKDNFATNAYSKVITDHNQIVRQTRNLQNHVIEKLSTMNNIIEELGVKLESVEKIRDMLKVQFKKYQLQIESCEHKFDTVKKENDKLTAAYNMVICSNEKLKNDLYSKNSEIVQLKESLEIRDSNNENLTKNNASLALTLNTLQIEILEKEEINRNMPNQVEAFVQTDNESYDLKAELQIRNFMTEVESLNNITQNLKDAIGKHEIDKIKLIEELNNVSKEKQQINTEYCLLKTVNMELRKELNSLNDIKGDLLEKVCKLNPKIDELSLQNEHLRCEKNSFISDYVSIKARSEDLNNQLKVLIENKEDLTNKTRKLNDDIEVLKEENSSLLFESSQLKSQISEEKNYNKTLAGKLDALQQILEQKIHHYEINAENSAEEKNTLKEQLKKSLEKNESLLNELMALKELKNEIEKNYDRCQEENLNLGKVVKDSNSLIKQLEEECTALKLATASLADNVLKLEQERDSLLLEKEKFEKEITNSNYQEKINAKENEITILKSQNLLTITELESLKEEFCTVERICKERKSHCKCLEEEIQKLKKHLEENELKNKTLCLRNQELLGKIGMLEKQNQVHLENLAQMKAKMSKLVSENSALHEENHNLLKLTKTMETEIKDKTNSIRNLELKMKSHFDVSDNKINDLKLELDNRNKECLELQTKLNTMTASNGKYSKFLENTKQTLESTQKQLTMESIERQKYQDKVEELSQQLNELKAEYNVCLLQMNDHKKAYLDVDLERDGQGDTKANLSPNKDLLKQLHEMQKMHLYKTRQLQDQIASIEAENTELIQKMAKSHDNIAKNVKKTEKKQGTTKSEERALLSPQAVLDSRETYRDQRKHQEIIENLLGENKQLKIKNEKLVVELEAARKLSQQDRKSRRQSTHDEKRQSLWDFSRDVGTMTQPTNKSCNCEDLDVKVNELKKSLLIKDCQINTLFSELKSNPLKEENEMLKKLISEEELEGKELRIEISKLKQKLSNQINEKRECSKCILESKRSYLHEESQTEGQTFEFSEEIAKLQRKCDDLRKVCRMRREKIEELESVLNKEKENEVNNKQDNNSKNVSESQLPNYEKLFVSLKEEHDLLKKKYDQCKYICVSRRDEISKLQEKLRMLESRT